MARNRWLAARRARFLVISLSVVVAAGAATFAGASTSASGVLSIVPPKACGQDATFKHVDPDGVLKTLPASVRADYGRYPFEVRSSPWKNWKGKKGPWTLAYVSFPVDNSWKVGLLNQLKQDFAAAKKKGLVTGSLKLYIQPSWTTATPEQQMTAINQFVKDGVDGILVQGLNSVAQTPAYEAAGKAGVPIVFTGDVAPFSKYATNFIPQNNSEPAAAVLGAIKKGNILLVRGAPGVATEEGYYQAWMADIKACPGAKVVGTVWGKWNPTVTKTEVLKWIASHPGVQVDAVFIGGAPGGAIEAFKQAGRPIPMVTFMGSVGGDRTWWADNTSTYKTYGSIFSGAQTARTSFRVMLRMLGGRGLKVRDPPLRGIPMHNANIKTFATPGKPLNWVADVQTNLPGGAPDALIDNKGLDAFFVRPGTPGGF